MVYGAKLRGRPCAVKYIQIGASEAPDDLDGGAQREVSLLYGMTCPHIMKPLTERPFFVTHRRHKYVCVVFDLFKDLTKSHGWELLRTLQTKGSESWNIMEGLDIVQMKSWHIGATVATSVALHSLHSNGVLHRDVKVNNIFCDDRNFFQTDAYAASPSQPSQHFVLGDLGRSVYVCDRVHMLADVNIRQNRCGQP